MPERSAGVRECAQNPRNPTVLNPSRGVPRCSASGQTFSFLVPHSGSRWPRHDSEYSRSNNRFQKVGIFLETIHSRRIRSCSKRWITWNGWNITSNSLKFNYHIKLAFFKVRFISWRISKLLFCFWRSFHYGRIYIAEERWNATRHVTFAILIIHACREGRRQKEASWKYVCWILRKRGRGRVRKRRGRQEDDKCKFSKLFF